MNTADPAALGFCARCAGAGTVSLAVADGRCRLHLGHRRSGRRPYRRLTHVGKWIARGHVVAPRKDRFVTPDVDLVAADIPDGYLWVTDRDKALALRDELEDVAPGWMRSDSRATRRAVWAAVVEHLDSPTGPSTGLAVAGQGQIAARASVHAGRYIARSTAGNHLRALCDAGVLRIPDVAGARGASAEATGGDRDRATSYVILCPAASVHVLDEQLSPREQVLLDELEARLDAAAASSVDELGHLPEGSAPMRVVDISPPRRSADFPRSRPREEAEPALPARRKNPSRFAPRGAAERALAVAWILNEMGWARKRLAEGEMLKIVGPFFSAGWSPRAILVGWQRLPDGVPWPGPLPGGTQRDSREQPRVQNLWAVLTSRLKAWRDPLGQPLAPPVQTLRPRRGRPPGPAAPPPPAPIGRPAQVDAELAALQLRLAAAAAQRKAEARRRGETFGQAFLDAADVVPPPPALEHPDGLSASQLVYRRAHLYRLTHHRGRGDGR